jgi:hypothetical protein
MLVEVRGSRRYGTGRGVYYAISLGRVLKLKRWRRQARSRWQTYRIVSSASPCTSAPNSTCWGADRRSEWCVYREPKRGRNDDGARRGANVT